MTDSDDSFDPLAPRRNPDLIGHGAAMRLLAETRRSGRLPHALLIGGPRGIGKATLAYRFARFLLAGKGQDSGLSLFGDVETDDDLRLDLADPVARRVASGGHADLMTVERSWDRKAKKLRGEIVIDDVREIARFLHLTPAEGGWRVVIVDGADEMNRNAANALLKVLEEPPRRALLILVCHAPGRLLPTIRSRCRRLTLQPLAEEDVCDLIVKHRPDLPTGDVAALAQLAGGSIGRALDLVDAGGLDLYRRMIDLLSGLPDPDIAALHKLAEQLARPDAADAFHTFAELLPEWLERIVTSLAEGGPAGDSSLAARIGGTGRLDRWVDVWDKLRTMFAQTDALNLDRKQAVLDAFFTLGAAFR